MKRRPRWWEDELGLIRAWWKARTARLRSQFEQWGVSESPIQPDLSAISFEMDNDDTGLEFGPVAPRYYSDLI